MSQVAIINLTIFFVILVTIISAAYFRKKEALSFLTDEVNGIGGKIVTIRYKRAPGNVLPHYFVSYKLSDDSYHTRYVSLSRSARGGPLKAHWGQPLIPSKLPSDSKEQIISDLQAQIELKDAEIKVLKAQNRRVDL